MALRERVEDYVGAFPDPVALNAWILESARRHIDLSPPGKLSQYHVRVTTNLPDPKIYRVLEVFREGVRCRPGEPEKEYLYGDQKSLYYATTEDPVMLIQSGAIVIFPVIASPTVLTGADCIKYPASIDCTELTAIADVPPEVTDLVVLDVAVRAFQQLLGVQTTQYAALATRLDTEEDIELAMTKMKEIETRIVDYRTKIGTTQTVYMSSLGAYTGRILQSAKETAQ